MVLAEIPAAFATIKSIGELVKQLTDLKGSTDRTELRIELQNQLIALQNIISTVQFENQKLMQEKAALEKQIADFENWNRDAKHYELEEMAAGVFVYVHKNRVGSSQQDVKFCTNCYNDRVKSILQRGSQDWNGTHYICPRCKTDFNDHEMAANPTL